MKNMKVSNKLITGFLLVIVLATIVGVTGIIGLNSMSNSAESMYSNMAIPMSDLALATEYFQRIRVQMRNAVIYAGDMDELQKVETDLLDRSKLFEDTMTGYFPTIVTEGGRQLFQDVMNEYNNVVKPSINDLIAGARSGWALDALLVEITDMTPAADFVAEGLRELTQLRLNVMSAANDDTTALFNSLFTIIIAVIIVTVCVALFIAFYISRLISRPLNDMKGYIQQAGETGNLAFSEEEWANCDYLARGKDEIGQTMKAFTKMMRKFVYYGEAVNRVADQDLALTVDTLGDSDTFGNAIQRMVDQLNHLFREINAATGQVAIGSGQVASGAQLLAQASTEQAATVQELSASVSEIADKTKANAERAEQAAKLADAIRQSAEEGNRHMDDMVVAVGEISQAGQDINRVIKVIDDIAFQTNILALNAAVEAARAGQHGKGFSVVAEEVRNLAAKSAAAAKDTGGLIANSIEKAELGSRIANETAASLLEIVKGIAESSRISKEIAASSGEQSLEIKMVNDGVDQVAQVVQQNSATAEESAAASEELSGQSVMLKGLIGQFRLREDRAGLQSFREKQKTLSSMSYIADNDPAEASSSSHGGFEGKY